MGGLRLDVRDARVEDAEAMVRLHFAAVHESGAREYPADVLRAWSPQPDERRFAWMRGQIEAGANRIVVVAESGGPVSGFCIFCIPGGFIHAVYVAPAASGRGIGRRLLRSAEQEMAAAGVSVATLKASKNALQFYLREGYAVSRPATQMLADGTQMDCLEMRKELPGIT